MKKFIQKLLQKFIKKAVKKAVTTEVPEVEPVVHDAEAEVVPNNAQTGVKSKDPWWVIVLKVIAYIIGLILGGVVTTGCVSHF